MLAPEKVQFEAKKRERENLAFRTYLKNNADEKELDELFMKLHNELFANYDCSECRNCCKQYHGSIPAEDIEKDASYLEITSAEFVEQYLSGKENDNNYQTIHKPCDFLKTDGTCLLNEHKPENCRNYPYTNQPGRLWSLYGMLEAVSVCPVAFEIYEQLKKEYKFRK